MGLLQIAAASAIGYGLFRFAKRQQSHEGRVAFADGETSGPNFAKVRNAGPEAMRSDPPKWEKTDQESDESFPASDPPGNY